MRRALVAAALLSLAGCRDFGALVARCFDGGPCADGGGGGPGGGTGGGTPVSQSDAGPLCGDGGTATLGDGGNTSFCFNGFAWENPKPQGNLLAAVWVAAPDDIWAAGTASMLMRWDGAQWSSWQNAAPTVRSPLVAPELGTIRALAGLDRTNVWLGGDDIPPAFFDGGTWVGLHNRADERISAMGVARLNGAPVVRAVGPGPTVERSPFFTASPLAIDTPNITGVAIASDGRCRILGNTGAMWSVHDCEDGGAVVPATLLPFPTAQPETTAIFVEDAGTFVFAVGTNLRRLGIDDTVTLGPGIAQAPLTVVTRTGPATLLAVDFMGQFYQASFSTAPLMPTAFFPQVTGLTTKEAPWLAASGFPGGSVVVGFGGAIARDNGSQILARLTRGPNFDFFALDVGPDDWLAAGENSAILTSGEKFGGGQSNDLFELWRSPAGRLYGVTSAGDLTLIAGTASTRVRAIGDGGTLRGIFGASENDVIVVGDEGLFQGKPDAGFSRVTAINEQLTHVHGAGGTAWAVGVNSAVVVRGADAGWTKVTQPAAQTTLWGVWLSGPTAGWIVGGNLTVLEIVGDTVTQKQLTADQFPQYSLFDVWGFDPSDVWAVGEHGAVIHFDGKDWKAIESGTHNRLESVRGRKLSNGRREIFIVGEYGTVLRKVY